MYLHIDMFQYCSRFLFTFLKLDFPSRNLSWYKKYLIAFHKNTFFLHLGVCWYVRFTRVSVCVCACVCMYFRNYVSAYKYKWTNVRKSKYNWRIKYFKEIIVYYLIFTLQLTNVNTLYLKINTQVRYKAKIVQQHLYMEFSTKD